MPHSATSLLVVGASARAAAFSAQRTGYAPLAIDLFADADLVDCCPVRHWDYQADTLVRIARQLPQCGWLYTGALENRPKLVELLAAERPLYGNHAEVLSAVRNPWKLSAMLKRHGFRAADVPGDVRDERVGSWVSKPLLSAGGAGVARVDGGRLPRGGRPQSYLQQFVPGPSFAALYVARDERSELLGITRQLIGASWAGAFGFRYSGSIGPVHPPDQVQDEFQRLGSVLAREFGLRGLFGIDAVVNELGVWALEVNPRYTASVEILERASQLNSIRHHVDACAGRPLAPVRGPAADHCFGKAILYARRQVPITEDFNRLVSGWNSGRCWPAIADIPHTGSTILKGCPVTTLFADAETVELVEAELRQRACELQEVLGC